MWFIAYLLCVRLWIWAKDFKVAEKGTSAYWLYLFLSKTASDSWQEPGRKSHVTRRVAGLSYATNKDRMSQLSSCASVWLITLDTSQEHSSRKDRRKWTVGLAGYLGRAAGETDLQSLRLQPHVCWAPALMSSPSFFRLCWYHSL